MSNMKLRSVMFVSFVAFVAMMVLSRVSWVLFGVALCLWLASLVAQLVVWKRTHASTAAVPSEKPATNYQTRATLYIALAMGGVGVISFSSLFENENVETAAIYLGLAILVGGLVKGTREARKARQQR